jgi:hypothetical protein
MITKGFAPFRGVKGFAIIGMSLSDCPFPGSWPALGRIWPFLAMKRAHPAPHPSPDVKLRTARSSALGRAASARGVSSWLNKLATAAVDAVTWAAVPVPPTQP